MLIKADNTKSYYSVLAERLRWLRQEDGISQEELGSKIGVTRQSISDYENGKKNPRWDLVVELAKHYGVSLDYLLGITDSKSKSQVVQEVSNEIGLSDNAINILRKRKKDKIYIHALSFLIENKNTLDMITEYMWSGFLGKLHETPGFRDLPKNNARIEDADKTLYAAILQGLGDFKTKATEAVEKLDDSEVLVEQILRTAARKYADIPACQDIWHKYGDRTYLENNGSSPEEERQQHTEFKDREYRRYEAIEEYLAQDMESPKD